MNKQKISATLAALALMAGALVGVAGPAVAAQNEGVCPNNSTGHVTPASGTKTAVYTTTAPTYIVGYCVKAGSINQGNGPESVIVAPTLSITFSHSSNKDISHYSVSTATDQCLAVSGYQSSPCAVTLVATASVSVTDPTCDAPAQLVLGAISNATFGGDADTSALGYNIVATAVAGAEFSPGVTTKAFIGSLDDVLSSTDPKCAKPKYPTCHAKEVVNAKNGWTSLSLPVTAIVSQGHTNHAGDIIPVIIPQFPAGQNLTTVYAQHGGLTGAQVLDAGCPDPDPDLATAAVSSIDATCVAGEKLILGAVSNASWGSATNLTGPLAYSFNATANAGAEFAGGSTTKTFAGTLDGPLPATDPKCDLPTFDLVMPKVTAVPPTCTAAGSFTLTAATGYNPAYVKWIVDGVTDVPSGTYPVTTSRTVAIVAVPVAPHGFDFGWVQPAPITFTVPSATACADLPTLAFTGSSAGGDSGLLFAGGLLVLGAAGAYTRRLWAARS